MVLTVHALATVFMTGIIWWVQVVQYPLFACVGADEFPGFHEQHVRRVSWVVAPAMTLEVLTGVLLLWMSPTDWLLWLGALLLGIIWGSTAWLQVPLHRKLEKGFQPRLHSRLVSSNWLRTTAWSARTILVLYLLVKMPRAT